MKRWAERVREEAYLLNPAFSAINLTVALAGYEAVAATGMPFPLSFMVLPVVLHRTTREALPVSTRTSMPAWLQEHAEARVFFFERITSLRPHTREALHFGLHHGLLATGEGGSLRAVTKPTRVDRMLRKMTGELRECALKARLVGKWLASTGSPATAMALWGIRP